MTNCLFCKIANKEIPAQVVYENDDVMAFLSIKPVRPGHSIIVPKRHSDSLNDCDPVDLQALVDGCQRLTRSFERLDIHGVHVITNVGPDTGREIAHTHFHLIPRRSGDGLTWWPENNPAPGELDEWAAKLRGVLR